MPIPASTPIALTIDAWLALDEDVDGELVDGYLEEEEVASWEHELVVSWLIAMLRAWFMPRGGFVLGSETKIIIAPKRGRKPDVMAFFGTRRPGPTAMPPDIVVEVVSATPQDKQRDRVDKRADYAAIGVGQYWLIDPVARTFEILSLCPDGRYLEVLGASKGTHEVPGCEGLRLDLDALWLEVAHGLSFFVGEVTDSDA